MHRSRPVAHAGSGCAPCGVYKSTLTTSKTASTHDGTTVAAMLPAVGGGVGVAAVMDGSGVGGKVGGFCTEYS